MRFPRRLLRAVLATVLLTTGVVGALSLTDVGAAEKAAMVVTWEKESIATYGPMAVPNLTAQAQDPTPQQCRTSPAPVVTVCDVIPVKVILPPDFNEFEEYAYTTVSLVWEDDPVGVGANDLDMYLFDANGDPLGSSASSSNPESAKTESQNFFIVVNNFSGFVPEYSVRLKVSMEVIEKPFELPEPPRPSSSGFGLPTGSPFIDNSPGAGSFGIPTGVDGAPSIVSGSTTGPTGTVGKIELVPAPGRTVDLDFEEVQKELEAAEQAAADTPASSEGVSAGVWFWLVLLPLAVVALAGAWLIRRRPATLKR